MRLPDCRRPLGLFAARSAAVLASIALVQAAFAQSAQHDQPVVSKEGVVQIPALEIPLSRYMSEEAKKKFIEEALDPALDRAVQNRTHGVADAPLALVRAGVDDVYRPMVDRAKARYPVDIKDGKIDGIPVQIVTPVGGVAAHNRGRVLVNLHGGAYDVGAGMGGLIESIPLSALQKIKVISVDYRMAPEYHFPAASEDVTAVYRTLLKKYRAKNIGIYGCSAGGSLSAMSVAWMQANKMPMPGAVGIFGAGAFGSFLGSPADANTWGGDSRYTAPPLVGEAPVSAESAAQSAANSRMDYLANTRIDDPLVSPALSADMLRRFPPTLLISGTRAFDLSAAAETQRRLNKAGVDAELHVWDGMWHCFFLDTDLPESRETYAVIAEFFEGHLGKEAKSKGK